MNFLSLLPVFQTLIDRLLPDKEKADQAQIAMQKVLNEAQARSDEAQAKQIEAQKDVIVAELSKNNWASNWRAYMMMVCITMVAFNWFLAPLLNAFLGLLGAQITTIPIPPELWTLVTVGLGGYIGKETIQNYSENKYKFDDKAFFSKLRQHGLLSTQSQVDLFNDALNEGKK